MPKTKTPDHMTGAELQTLREACNLSRDELADLAGVQARSVKHWESGRSGVPADVCGIVLGLDAAISHATAQAIDAVRNAQPQPDDLVLMRYRANADMKPAGTSHTAKGDHLPASAHGAIVGRVRQALQQQANPVPVRVVWFEPAAFTDWRTVHKLPDTQATRSQWAAEQVQRQAIPHRGDQPTA